MLKHTIMFAAVAGLVLALGGSAPAGLIGYWPMDEGTGASTADASTNSNNGTLYNMEADDWVTGKIGDYALNFDQAPGSHTPNLEWVNCNEDSSLDVTSAITMSAWIKREGTTDRGHIINMGGGWDNPGYSMFWKDDYISAELQGNGVKTVNNSVGIAGTGTWQHIVIRWDKNGADYGADNLVRVHFDGVQNATTTARSVDIAAASQNFHIAQNANHRSDVLNFEGAIDDVAVWNEALTGDETTGLYDVAASVDLGYGAGDFDLLRQVHDGTLPSVTIGSLIWTRQTGLAGSAGLSSSGVNFTLVLDDANDTGVVSIPEPATMALVLLGLPFVMRRRRRS